MKRTWIMATLIAAFQSYGQNPFSLTFATAAHGGPKNHLIVFVTSGTAPASAANYVDTVGIYATSGNKYLSQSSAWVSLNGGRTFSADVRMGATRPNWTAPVLFNWDLKDRYGNLVPDGTYRIHIENVGENNNRRYGSFPFIKNSTVRTENVAAFSTFSAIRVVYNPSAVGNYSPAFTVDPFSAGSATEDSPYSGTIAGSATDVDGDPLTYSKISGPAWLNVALNGALSGTPLQADVGPNSFRVQVSDGKRGIDTATLSLWVENVNDAPAFTSDPVEANSAVQDVAYSDTLIGAAVDEDGDSVTYVKLSGPEWLDIAPDGALSGTPTLADIGLNVFEIQASDGTGGIGTAMLHIPVSNVNHTPVFIEDPVAADPATTGMIYSGSISGSASDEEGDPLTYSKVDGPAWLNVASDGLLSGTPGVADVGTNSWVVQVDDGNGGTDTATLNLMVKAAAGGAKMTAGYFIGSGLLRPSGEILFVDYAALGGRDTTANSGYSDAFTVLINGFGRWKIGDTVEITGIALPIHASSLNGTMTFTVLQGAGGTGDTGAGGLAVLGAATASYNNSGTTGNMYVNFAAPISFVVDANSTRIGINISNTALLKLKYDATYPIPQYNRSTGNTVSHMRVSVAGKVNPAPANRPPTFTVDPIDQGMAIEGKAYSGSITNATDIDGDTLFYSRAFGPAWLSVAANGILSGIPGSDDVGTNSWTVQVSDGISGNDKATLNIFVDYANHAPTFINDPFNAAAADEDSPYSGTITGSATDSDGDSLTYSKIAGPAWLSVSADGLLSGTPVQADVGLNSWTVQVDDGNGKSDTATLSIMVENVNDAPVFISDLIKRADAGQDLIYSGSITGTASDEDSDPLTYARLSGPDWLNIAPNGSLSGSPGSSDAGLNNFEVRVSDGSGASDTATLNITVVAFPINADGDGDGMPDAWEVFTGLDPSSDDFDLDSDGDGFSNGSEYVAGTDPLDAASYFRMIACGPAEHAGSVHFVIRWEAVPKRVCNVLWTASLTNEFQMLERGFHYPQNSYTDTVHSVEWPGYYRLYVTHEAYDADGNGIPDELEDTSALEEVLRRAALLLLGL